MTSTFAPELGIGASDPQQSSTLISRAVRGEHVARRPLWVMRQAGRILPEYRALKEKHSFLELSRNAELAAEVTLLPFRHFDFDAAITFADIMSPLPALGVDLDFAPGPIIAEPIRSRAQVERLADPDALDVDQIAPEVYLCQKLVRSELPKHRALLGFGGAPLTLAAYLVEGRGVRDFPQLRAFMRAEPEAFSLLMDKLTRLVARYLIEQHRSGAEAVQVFDSWAGLLELKSWRALVRPHLLRLLETLGEAGVPRILFLHSAPQLVEEFAMLPCEVLAVDWRTDLGQLRERHPNLVMQGNLDPAIMLAPTDIVRQHVRALLASLPAQGHILNLGHGVLPNTPLESLHALLDEVHKEQQA